MAYAEDLKFSGAKAPCGFESRPRHHDLLTDGQAYEREIDWKPVNSPQSSHDKCRFSAPQSSTIEEPVGWDSN